MPSGSVDLAGKYVNQSGSPKVGYTVSLYEAATWEAAGSATASDTTDSDGLWNFDTQDITKTWIVVAVDGTKKTLLDARNKIQLTNLDLIDDLSVNTIYEHTVGSGVTIDGVIIKDNGLNVLDAADTIWGTGADAAMRWSTGDANNHALVLALGNSNQGFHITDKGAIATDWNIAATTHPNVYIHSNTTPATDYLRLGDHNGTTAYIDVVGGTTLELQIAGTGEVSLTATVLAPVTSDGVALGSTSLMWGDLFLASGAVINFNNGDVTLTHAANQLTLAGGPNLVYSANTFAYQEATTISTTTGNLTLDPAGRVVFTPGGTGGAVGGVHVNGTLTAITSGAGFEVEGGNTWVSDWNMFAVRIAPTMDTASSGTHPNAATVNIEAVAITVNGSADITRAATLRLAGPPTGATSNYTLLVDSGAVRLDGSLWVESTPTEGSSGEQLTSGGAGTIMTWAAASSRREWKNLLAYEVTPADALDRILGTRVYPFTFKDGYGTHDYETEYLGVLADEAPWAMHHNGGILNPISTFGHTVLAFQAHEDRIKRLEAQVIALGGALEE